MKCHDSAPHEGDRFIQVEEEFAVSLHKTIALVVARNRPPAVVLNPKQMQRLIRVGCAPTRPGR